MGSAGDFSQGEQPQKSLSHMPRERAVATRNHQRPLCKKYQDSESGRIDHGLYYSNKEIIEDLL